jgi:phospholipid transport system substrate-binding protein
MAHPYRLLSLICLLGFSSLTLAQEPQLSRNTSDPIDMLQEGVQTLSRYLKTPEITQSSQFYHFLDTKIVPYFDFEYMAKISSGYHYRSLSAAQRSQLTSHIKHLFIQSMVTNLAHHRHSTITFLPLRGHATSREVLLTAQLKTNRRTPPSHIHFRLYRSHQGWKVFDVSTQGVSAIAYYRRMVSRLVHRYGVHGMINQLPPTNS